MKIRNTSTQYGAFSKFLHWAIALLVLFQVYLVYWKQWMLPEKSEIAKFYINGLHKPTGIVILVLAIIALFWRWVNAKPGFPSSMPNWEKKSAVLVHRLLYLGLLVMPISGFVMSVAAGYPPNFFGLYQFPQWIEKNKEIAGLFFEIHQFAGFLMIALVFIHILAALKHHFIDKDGILKRMLPFNS